MFSRLLRLCYDDWIHGLCSRENYAGCIIVAKSVHWFIVKAVVKNILLVIVCGALSLFKENLCAQVVINEVMADNNSAVRNGANYPDYVELYNVGLTNVNIGGWGFTDSTNTAMKFVIPANTILVPGQYLVLWCDANTTDPGIHTGFTIKAGGDDVSLYQPSNTNLPVDSVVFGMQVADLTISRIPNGTGTWQLSKPTPNDVNQSVVLGIPFALRINEWMATNSAGPDKDWLELYNPPTNGPVNMTGLIISGTTVTPSGDRAVMNYSFIASGGFVRFWCSSPKAKDIQPDTLDFKLSSTSGETVSIYATDKFTIIDRISFPGAYLTQNISMGRLPDGATNFIKFPLGQDTPAASNFQKYTNLVVNEVLAHTDPPLEDAVEFYNPTAQSADISYFWLSNSQDDPKKFRMPAGTIIPPYSFKVFYEKDFNPDYTGSDRSFTFNSAKGDQVNLTSADASGNLTGYRLFKDFSSTENGVSLGRYVKSDGGSDFVSMSSRSFGVDTPQYVWQFQQGTGMTNPYPKIGPVVISEIMYHPRDIQQGTNFLDNLADEYIALQNMTSTNVDLFRIEWYYTNNANRLVTNSWKINNAVEYYFPTNSSPVTLLPGEKVLVISFDPSTNTSQTTAYRSKYNIGSDTRIFGPYTGKLSNGSATIELLKPDFIQQTNHPDASWVPYIPVEKVTYDDSVPWPTNNVDGGGWSLHRRSLTGYANDQTNWFAGEPNPGQLDTAPGISTPATNQNGTVGSNIVFSVAATGVGPFVYNWYFNGTLLPFSMSNSLTITNAQTANNGTYSVVVSNALGVTSNVVGTLLAAGRPQISSPAALTNHTFSAGFGVVTGRTYTIQYTTNLIAWTNLITISNASGPVSISEPTTNLNKYYRSVLLP